MKIIKPSEKVVKEYLDKWGNLESYVLQESSLKKLFTKTYPLNNNMDEVLIKVCSLNDFYSTNIFSPFKVAKHIVSLKIDLRLEKNDLELVNDIAKVKVNDKKEINFYSFATKYCSHHKPTIYPIYDSFVDKLLMYFKKSDKFSAFKNPDLKNYSRYREILIDFQNFYSLQNFNLKEIDKYLWQAGKDYFPVNYKKTKKTEISNIWNGYCPESLLKGKKVRMRLNHWDFYESEQTGLQICVLDGFFAVILNFRGEGKFRTTISYGHEIAKDQFLCPQNIDKFPFNKPPTVFNESEEINNYIENIKK